MSDDLSPRQSTLKRWGEFALKGFLGNLLESGLQKIQVTKHIRRAEKWGVRDKVIFTADICKGHYDSHNHKTMSAYKQRIEEYNLSL
jgi:hypothetical protein